MYSQALEMERAISSENTPANKIGFRTSPYPFSIVPFWDNLGNVQREVGRFKEALRSHKRAEKILGPNSYSFNNLGVLSIELDKRKEAKEYGIHNK